MSVTSPTGVGNYDKSMIYFFIVLCVLLSAFFSGSETAFLTSDRLQVELDRAKRGIGPRAQTFLFDRPGKYITTVLVANNVINVIYGLLFAALLEPVLKQWMTNAFLIVLIQTLISTAVVIVFGEYVPKSVAKARPNEYMQLASLPLTFAYFLFYPITLLAGGLTNLILKLFGAEGKSNDQNPLGKVDLDYYIRQNTAAQDDPMVQREAVLLQNALEFPDIQVRDCLVPRNELSAVDEETTIEELMELFIRTGYSKIIVYRETIDNVIGYIHSTEMFRCHRDGSRWQEHIKETIYVPETLTIEKVMQTLLLRKRGLAIVVDELGGTSGIVTLEDIVEEIFGDIEDEHDTVHIVMRKVSDEEYILSGRAGLDDINDKFQIGLPEEEDFKTIAGYILSVCQSIPGRGEVVELSPRFSAEILRASENKIILVRLLVRS